MSHASGSRDLRAQRSFRSQCDAILGGLTVDQIFAGVLWLVCGIGIGDFRSQAVALFAYQEQQADIRFLLFLSALKRRSASR